MRERDGVNCHQHNERHMVKGQRSVRSEVREGGTKAYFETSTVRK